MTSWRKWWPLLPITGLLGGVVAYQTWTGNELGSSQVEEVQGLRWLRQGSLEPSSTEAMVADMIRERSHAMQLEFATSRDTGRAAPPLDAEGNLNLATLGSWSQFFEPLVMPGQRTALVFSSQRCPPCEGLPQAIISNYQEITQGVSQIVVVESHQREATPDNDHTAGNGAVIVSDPTGDLSEIFSITGWPTTLIFEDGRYLGQLKYFDLSIERDKGNNLLYRQPYTLALSNILINNQP